MQKQHFSIFINAPAEKVYNTTIGPETYPIWTAPFNPTGRMEGSWDQGSEIRFIGEDPQTGEEGGMFAVLKKIVLTSLFP